MRAKLLVMGMMVCCLVSCKKEDEYPKGSASAEFNGDIWKPDRIYGSPSRFGKDNLFEIDIVKTPGGMLSQNTGFGNVEKNYEVQKLYPSTGNQSASEKLWSNFITTQDYDVTGDTYYLLESDTANNWLQITSADDNFTKNIRGTFSATYYRAYTYQGSPNPDTIRLRKGTFYISKLKE